MHAMITLFQESTRQARLVSQSSDGPRLALSLQPQRQRININGATPSKWQGSVRSSPKRKDPRKNNSAAIFDLIN